ncbi:hypothetical protein TRFO_32440 [Tritrichomonas foetus]|uniref:Protein kinase domain-containing protein n=1 Tax=Tritrichomonas foetus TaxID=1144522 RepID=A0A1J4JU29_9EUKA|nr:hypothetical protein TRFO_32440 [Tritrichomonas foetus]|eukprot:OHT00757.1 hypothetical protein TRFO_32440 [Tritrichomonas foetus]
MIRGNHYTIASDIWSAGILLYAMCVGELPFEDDNMQRLFQKITFKEPNYPTTISPALKDLLCRLLTKNPNDRITLQKIKEHPWFSQYQYSQMMDMNFGIVCDWRIIGGNTDRDIIQIMNNHGYECTHLVNDLFDNKTNNLTAVYRMLRKSKISDEMRDVSLSSLLHSKRLHKVNTILNQFAKTTVKPIPKPIITDCKIQRPTQDFSKSPVSNKLSLCRQDSADVTKSTPMYNLRTRSINLPKHGEISKLIAKPYSSNFLQQRRRSSSMREPSPLIPTANPV